MPVLWNAFHSTRLVTITFEGVACRKDLDDCTDGIMTPATLSYRKLVDLRNGSLALSPEDIAALAERVRECGQAAPMGALAILVLPGECEQHAPLFAALAAAADRPLKVFSDVGTARDWLNTVPPSPTFRPEDPLAA
jgi:hypothetical protein